MSKINP